MATTITAAVSETHQLQTLRQDATTAPFCAVRQDTDRTPAQPSARPNSNLRLTTIILQLAGINLLSSFTNGVLTVSLPTISQSLSLPRSLTLWPLSVYGLTCGSTLLLSGSITDVIGARRVEIFGCFCLGAFILACGFADDGVQLTTFRALQGVAMAMHLPAAVAIATESIPAGRKRNLAFATLGFARDIGYSVGLVLSGILVETKGWRLNFFLAGGGVLILAIIGIWNLPRTSVRGAAAGDMLSQLRREMDWVGGFLITGGLSILAYVLAVLSGDLSTIKSPTTSSLLGISIVLLIAFPFWMAYRERHQRPALIPNSLWTNLSFTSTCIILALSNGAVIALELFSSLYFQEIQNKGTLTTSLQLLPNVAVGVAVGLSCGLFVHKVAAGWLISATSILCACAPLMMAVMNPAWTYWYMAFWAQALSPISVSVLVTIGMLIVSESFPDKSQALAGAVFNTVANFGLSFGVGLCQLVALGVSENQALEGHADGSASNADSERQEITGLLRGYKASFWTMHTFMMLCAIVGLFGLRKVGKVGLKRD